jgi:hypothetical protein
MKEPDQHKEKSPDEEKQAAPADTFSAMERLGRSFLEKTESSRADLKALRDMHRRRTRAQPQDPEAE